MKRPVRWRFAAIMFLIGLMASVQYNSIRNPEERDTRDIWQIRKELAQERERTSALLTELSAADNTLHRYSDRLSSSPGAALRATVGKLSRQAGVSPASMPGVLLLIQPSPEAQAAGQEVQGLTADLLARLTNEIYRYKGVDVAIDGKRLTVSSGIRDINGLASIGYEAISPPPVVIRIGTRSYDDASKLEAALESSPIQDDFYIEGLLIETLPEKKQLSLPGTGKPVRLHYLKSVEKEGR